MDSPNPSVFLFYQTFLIFLRSTGNYNKGTVTFQGANRKFRKLSGSDKKSKHIYKKSIYRTADLCYNMGNGISTENQE